MRSLWEEATQESFLGDVESSLNLHLSLNEQADWRRAMKGHPHQAGEQRGRSAENRWLTVEIFEPCDMEYI